MQANDPTRLGSSPIAGAGHAVRLSLSETQALCAKAARGAGFDWGHSDAAGHAAQWLAARGLPGCELLLQRLHSDALRPRALGPSQDPDAALCPVHLGTALADHAGLPEVTGQTALELGHVVLPGLLMPFLATTARLSARHLRCSADEHSVTFRADGGPEEDRGLAALCTLPRAQIRVTFPPERRPQTQAQNPPAELPLVPQHVWRALDALALRVTVPSSTRSVSGAGSGGSDND